MQVIFSLIYARCCRISACCYRYNAVEEFSGINQAALTGLLALIVNSQ